MIRKIVEWMLRDATRLRRMPAEFSHAPIIVSTAGGLRPFLKPMAEAEPELFAAAKAAVRPGDNVWDIGTNLGLFSVAAAACATDIGTVSSFEPDIFLVGLLRRTASLQPKSSAPITIVPAGVAGATGLRSFAIAKRARASNALQGFGTSQTGGTRELQTIACYSVDACLAWLPQPHVVKIDVEAAELEVLGGAQKLLASVRPVIIIEIAVRNQAAATEIFKNNKYAMFDWAKPLTTANQSQICFANTIAIPIEKLAIFTR
jgi:FkbM family methyltransferase